MPGIEPGWTLVNAACVLGVSTPFGTGQPRVQSLDPHGAAFTYEDACVSMFSSLNRAFYTRSKTDDSIPSTHAQLLDGETQLSLAQKAVARLAPNSNETSEKISTLVYATNSVDENLFRSSVANIAVQVGISSKPHFCISQAQGTALDIALQLMPSGMADERFWFVASERWPQPYPRSWGFIPLSDGAAALEFAYGNHPGLQLIDTVCVGFDAFIYAENPNFQISEVRDKIVNAACSTIQHLLDRSKLKVSALGGWLSASIDPVADSIIRTTLINNALEIRCIDPLDGDPQAAAGPTLLAGLLAELKWNTMLHGQLWLSWNVSLSGTISASIWKIQVENRDEINTATIA